MVVDEQQLRVLLRRRSASHSVHPEEVQAEVNVLIAAADIRSCSLVDVAVIIDLE